MKKILSIFFCVFLLSGCSEDVKTYEYTGESDHWKAVYKYEVQYLKSGENRSEKELKLTYIGDIKKIPSNTVIEYKYKIGSKGGSQTLEFEEINKSIEIKDSGGGLNVSTLEGSEIGTITISWDGNSEEFEIKNTKNEK